MSTDKDMRENRPVRVAEQKPYMRWEKCVQEYFQKDKERWEKRKNK